MKKKPLYVKIKLPTLENVSTKFIETMPFLSQRNNNFSTKHLIIFEKILKIKIKRNGGLLLYAQLLCF
jgi:hypothetical protein